jgi:hypothetical protein
MHSILNVGINDEVVEILAEMPGANRKFALDTYQRFLQTFGCNVLEVDSKLYDDALKAQKIQEGVESETDLSEEGLEHLVRIFKLIANVPQDPMSQFWMIIQKLYETMKSLPLHLFDLIDLTPPLPSSLSSRPSVIIQILNLSHWQEKMKNLRLLSKSVALPLRSSRLFILNISLSEWCLEI